MREAVEVVTELLPERRRAQRVKSKGKARASNGSTFLGPGADGRSVWARRCRDVYQEHLSDLGGFDATSAAERSLIRRAAILTVELERLEVKFAATEGTDVSAKALDLYQRSAGNLRRLLQTIGLQRRAKPVGPSLGDLIRQDQERERQRLAEERASRKTGNGATP